MTTSLHKSQRSVTMIQQYHQTQLIDTLIKILNYNQGWIHEALAPKDFGNNIYTRELLKSAVEIQGKNIQNSIFFNYIFPFTNIKNEKYFSYSRTL